jgi:hypothetical protein
MEPLLGSTPLSAGDLRTTPFAHVLVELLETEEHGTLFIHGEEQALEAAIRIEAGFPTAIGFEAQAENAKTAGGNLLNGLIPLCSRASGAFRFVSGQHIEMNLPAAARSRVDPLTLIMAASRGPLREDAVEQVMLNVARHLVKLNPRSNIERYALTAQERSIVDCLAQGPIDLARLREENDAPERVLRRVLYVLRVTHALTLLPLVRRNQSGTVAHSSPLPERAPSQPDIVAPQGAGATARPPATNPGFVAGNPTVVFAAPNARPGSSPKHRAVSGTITGSPPMPPSGRSLPPTGRTLPPGARSAPPDGRASSPSNQSMPPGYSLPPGAGQSLPPRGKKNLPATRALLEKGAGRYSMAQPEHAVSSTFARTSAPPGQSARPERPDPEACFARAERLLRQREYAAALQAANEALRLGGDRAEHEALYGWLLCLQGGGTELRIHPRAMAHLDRALRHDPLCERANHYKGMVLKRLGRFDEAHQYFLRAMQVNRDNLEAAREVRLYDMRKRNRDSRPSLVNKLLKRFGDDE